MKIIVDIKELVGVLQTALPELDSVKLKAALFDSFLEGTFELEGRDAETERVAPVRTWREEPREAAPPEIDPVVTVRSDIKPRRAKKIPDFNPEEFKHLDSKESARRLSDMLVGKEAPDDLGQFNDGGGSVNDLTLG